MTSCTVTNLDPNARLASARAFGPSEFGLLMERSSDAALLTGVNGRILYVNRAFEEITGYAREEAVGQTPSLLKSGHQSREFYQSLWNTLRAGRHFTGVLVNRRKSGELFHEEKSIWALVNGQGGVTHYVSIGRDVSRRVARMEHLVRAATYDSLTNLPNRASFMDRLEQALRHTKRTAEPLLVALLDVDRFKAVNDSLGHQAGDALLREIAARLRRSVREEDTVARLGGDEFAMVLPGVTNAEAAERILRKITESFTSPIAIDGLTLGNSISMGGCFWTGPPWEQEALLALADQALYRVKRGGGNGFLLETAAPEALAGDSGIRHMFAMGALTECPSSLHASLGSAHGTAATARRRPFCLSSEGQGRLSVGCALAAGSGGEEPLSEHVSCQAEVLGSPRPSSVPAHERRIFK